MKKYITLLLFSISFLSISAQKVTTKPVEVNFTHLPKEPLPPKFKTYRVEVKGSEHTITKVLLTTRQSIADYFKLNSFVKSEDSTDLVLEINVDDITIFSEETKSETKTTKDKSGKEVKKTKHYKEIKYSMNLGHVLMSESGEELRKKVPLSGFATFKSDKVANKNWLEEYWVKNREALLYNHVIARFKEGMKSNLINLRIGINNYRVEMESIGGKNEEAKKYETAYENTRTAFANLEANGSVEKAKIELQPVIDFYQKESDQYDPNAKKEMKWRHVCLYNLAFIHYWLDEVELAEEYALACQEIDWKNNRIKKMLENIQELKESLEKSGFSNRHPNLALSD